MSRFSIFVSFFSLVQLWTMSVSGKSTKGNTSLPSAPDPPPEYNFPANFRPKRCVRCGAWSTQLGPYPQEQSPERSWRKLLAWESGSLLCPQGKHCLLCRKAGSMVGQWVVSTSDEICCEFVDGYSGNENGQNRTSWYYSKSASRFQISILIKV